jgi:hypothetical protein
MKTRVKILIGRETKNQNGTPITASNGRKVMSTIKTHSAMFIDDHFYQKQEIVFAHLYTTCRDAGYKFGRDMAQKGLRLEDKTILNGYALNKSGIVYSVECVSEMALKVLEANIKKGYRDTTRT